jgi:hypothetical protein
MLAEIYAIFGLATCPTISVPTVPGDTMKVETVNGRDPIRVARQDACTVPRTEEGKEC